MSELLAVNRPRVDRYAGCNMYSTTRLLDWRVEKKVEVLWVLVGVPDDPSPRSPNRQDKIHLQLKGNVRYAAVRGLLQQCRRVFSGLAGIRHRAV